MHLKGLISVRINIGNVSDNSVTQLLKALILNIYHRTDAGNAEYLLQTFYCLIVVKFSLSIHIDPSLGFMNEESALSLFQGKLDLMTQGILKQIAILSFYTDFGIFYQKSCKHKSSFLRTAPAPAESLLPSVETVSACGCISAT